MPRLSQNRQLPAPDALSKLPELVKPAQLTHALGIAKSTLWRWCKAGIGPKRVAVGATVFFQREDVLVWLEKHKRAGL